MSTKAATMLAQFRAKKSGSITSVGKAELGVEKVVENAAAAIGTVGTGEASAIDGEYPWLCVCCEFVIFGGGCKPMFHHYTKFQTVHLLKLMFFTSIDRHNSVTTSSPPRWNNIALKSPLNSGNSLININHIALEDFKQRWVSLRN